MPKIGDSKETYQIPCDRCNSKRRVSKTWIEKIENQSGFMVVRHAQIVCTNRQCQLAFEKTILADIEKREKLKLAKLSNSTHTLPPKPTA